MSKCQICHTNEAVIFLTRIEEGKRSSEGICLKCAYEKGIGGMDELFARSGINNSNIDELQQRVNQVMEQMGSQSPGDFLKAMMSPDFDPSVGFIPFNPEGAESGFPSSDEEQESERAKPRSLPGFGELQPATTGPEGDRTTEEDDKRSNRKKQQRKRKFLDQFGTNLTEMAEAGLIDCIVGREVELARVIQILNRRGKNNPALLGEPGVGKTAVAYGLAYRIARREVPVKLFDKQIYQLDLTAMVAGTQFRGQFESRMKGVVDDAKSAGNVILVIDELHNIMGAGDAEGAMNAANILKPALAQGEICVIGCTTLEEYRRFIEKDSALERRFQKVIIEEPNSTACLEILRGVRPYYEAHHHVSYSERTLEAAVRLSDRYIQERYLPDKAIDLLDESGSRVNLDNELLAEIHVLAAEIEESKEQLEAIDSLLEEKNSEAERLPLFEKGAAKRSQLLRQEAQLQELQSKFEPVAITVEDIAQVVEMWTGIPVRQITESESAKLSQLEERLHRRVIGQDKAICGLAKAIRRKRAGFGKRNKPSSFLFVGPTGVGKTELAKSLAEVLFESEDALVRLDMSEFMEPHTVSKLIGSPPGYVGYDDGGQLTEKIRRHPYSVILLDEIEKAHKDVYNMLLQILDDGRLTDSHGRVVRFENTVLIMTSNAGTTLKGGSIGFGKEGVEALESRVQTVLQEIFRPEFLNRVDDIIVFSELSRAEIRQIVDLMLLEVEAQLKLHELSLEVSDAARTALGKKGYDPKFGARPLRKTIQRELEDVLSDKLLAGELEGKKVVKLDYVEAEFDFNIQ